MEEAKFTVFVGGVEVNDRLLTDSEAQDLEFEYRKAGYTDVVIVDTTLEIENDSTSAEE